MAALAGLVSVWVVNRGHTGASSVNRSQPPDDLVFTEAQADTGRFSEIRARSQALLVESGLSSSEAEAASTALEHYVSGTASHDLDALLALAHAHGAEVDPVLTENTRRLLTVMPDHAKPQGAGEWSDADILRNTLYKTKSLVWKAADAEHVDIVRFRSAGTLVDEMKFYRIGPQPGGGEASIFAAPFRVRDLERKLQQGEAQGAIVTFPVINQDDERRMISVLLGEYTPGKWYPVRHKTVLQAAK